MKQIDKTIYDVCIIGGGYSGLVLATYCARASLLVCILERNAVLGKKILSTGNGRCNFTNSNMSLENFNSSSNKLSEIEFKYKNSLNFFNSLGVKVSQTNGYYYPYSNQAKTIKEMLENSVYSLGVDVYLNSQVKNIEKNSIYKLKTADGKEILGKNVVIATGGLAAPKTGSNGDGIYLAKKLGIETVDCVPALVGLTSTDSSLKLLAGVRAYGRVSYNAHSFEGEIQFNKDGISGYPVMCLSRYISYDLTEKKNIKVAIDFFPEDSIDSLMAYIKTWRKTDISTDKVLSCLCNEKIIASVMKRLNILQDSLFSKCTPEQLENIFAQLKSYIITIDNTKGYEFAQTTAGGISLDSVDLSTMMVKNEAFCGLYCIGEVVDVDGICGGYNLEWARTSAQIAANSIIDKESVC